MVQPCLCLYTSGNNNSHCTTLYKPRFSTYNVVDSVLVLLLALWFATIVCTNIAELKAHKWSKVFASLSYIVGVLPLFYISFVALHWMCSRREFG